MSLSFTNFLFIDEAFAKECQREGNLIFVMSVEGKEEDTDLEEAKVLTI